MFFVSYIPSLTEVSLLATGKHDVKYRAWHVLPDEGGSIS